MPPGGGAASRLCVDCLPAVRVHVGRALSKAVGVRLGGTEARGFQPPDSSTTAPPTCGGAVVDGRPWPALSDVPRPRDGPSWPAGTLSRAVRRRSGSGARTVSNSRHLLCKPGTDRGRVLAGHQSPKGARHADRYLRRDAPRVTVADRSIWHGSGTGHSPSHRSRTRLADPSSSPLLSSRCS